MLFSINCYFVGKRWKGSGRESEKERGDGEERGGRKREIERDGEGMEERERGGGDGEVSFVNEMFNYKKGEEGRAAEEDGGR